MKKTISIAIVLILFSMILFSCATQKAAEKKIEKEIQSETVVRREEVTESARDYILRSETLSELQKKNLVSLFDKTNTELKAMSEEINKSKLVLVKTMLRPKVNEREVFILNKKIKKLSKKRMDSDFKSFDEARKIIDPLKEVRDREFLYNSFMLRHHYYW